MILNLILRVFSTKRLHDELDRRLETVNSLLVTSDRSFFVKSYEPGKENDFESMAFIKGEGPRRILVQWEKK